MLRFAGLARNCDSPCVVVFQELRGLYRSRVGFSTVTPGGLDK